MSSSVARTPPPSYASTNECLLFELRACEHAQNIVRNRVHSACLLGSRQAKMRRVDRVVVKGSHVPMDLYCYDEAPKLASSPEGGAEGGWEEAYEGERGFVRALLEPSSPPPKSFYEKAISLYIEGRWLRAAAMLSAWARCCPEDSPATVVLGVMKDRLALAELPLTSESAPEEWASPSLRRDARSPRRARRFCHATFIRDARVVFLRPFLQVGYRNLTEK